MWQWIFLHVLFRQLYFTSWTIQLVNWQHRSFFFLQYFKGMVLSSYDATYRRSLWKKKREKDKKKKKKWDWRRCMEEERSTTAALSAISILLSDFHSRENATSSRIMSIQANALCHFTHTTQASVFIHVFYLFISLSYV